MNSKKFNLYKLFLISMIIVMIGIMLAMGIIAVQKSMKLKIGINISPSFEVKIDYSGETIFCNTTKDGNEIKTSNDFTLSGNTLSFKQTFMSLGESFTFTIYNYTTKNIKISVSGTGVSGDEVIIAAYSTTVASGTLTINTPAGAETAILTVEEIELVLRESVTIVLYSSINNNVMDSVTKYYTDSTYACYLYSLYTLNYVSKIDGILESAYTYKDCTGLSGSRVDFTITDWSGILSDTITIYVTHSNQGAPP